MESAEVKILRDVIPKNRYIDDFYRSIMNKLTKKRYKSVFNKVLSIALRSKEFIKQFSENISEEMINGNIQLTKTGAIRIRTNGWEIAAKTERVKSSMLKRAKIEWNQLKVPLLLCCCFVGIYYLAAWLAGCPFKFTTRIASNPMIELGWAGTTSWGILWSIVVLAALFEFMDSSAGMGYGTALVPALLLMDFHPLQVIPCVMISEAITGIVAGVTHGEFQNVEWKFRPMSRVTKLAIVISLIGCGSVAFSITAVYKLLAVGKIWIKLYVAILLLAMAFCALYKKSRKKTPFRPKLMYGFSALAGFNKGIGGGGYGPVVTVGGLSSGVPAKSMVAITSLAEGITCLFAIGVWFFTLASGVNVDYGLLPSFIIGTSLAAIAAPYATRVFPQKLWNWVIPCYCFIISCVCFYKIMPGLINELTKLF